MTEQTLQSLLKLQTEKLGFSMFGRVQEHFPPNRGSMPTRPASSSIGPKVPSPNYRKPFGSIKSRFTQAKSANE